MNLKNSVLKYLIYSVIFISVCVVVYKSKKDINDNKSYENTSLKDQNEFISKGINENYDSINIDVEKSKLSWIGKKIHENHYGTIEISNGKIFIKENKVVEAFLKIDMNTIECTDIESEVYNNKLVEHLKNQDFFEVNKHPYAEIFLNFNLIEHSDKFQLSDMQQRYDASGIIVIKGIKQSISEDFIITYDDNMFYAHGEIEIDRTDFNIKYKSGKFFPELADKIILDEFSIKFELYTEK